MGKHFKFGMVIDTGDYLCTHDKLHRNVFRSRDLYIFGNNW